MNAEQLHALHTLTTPSLDPHFPLFQQYPAMKLGVRANVRFYGSLLAPLAASIIASQPDTVDWVVTAPPLYALPAGANLMAWEVSRLLSLRSVDLRYAHACGPSTLQGRDYANSGIEDRIRNRRSLHEGTRAPKLDPADFQGRAVLFINDINVTGTQQHFIQQTLAPVQPASIHWLYVIQVDPDLGRSNPGIEYSLNNLHLNTFEEFAETVAHADIDYTSRCLTRLFGYSREEVERLVRSIDPSRRKRLHELAIEEGAFGEEHHKASLALLAAD